MERQSWSWLPSYESSFLKQFGHKSGQNQNGWMRICDILWKKITVDKPWTNRGTTIISHRKTIFFHRTTIVCRGTWPPKNQSKIILMGLCGLRCCFPSPRQPGMTQVCYILGIILHQISGTIIPKQILNLILWPHIQIIHPHNYIYSRSLSHWLAPWLKLSWQQPSCVAREFLQRRQRQIVRWLNLIRAGFGSVGWSICE